MENNETPTQEVFFRKHKKAIEWNWGLDNFKQFMTRFIKRDMDEDQWTFDYESYVLDLNEEKYEHPQIWAAEYYGNDWDKEKWDAEIEDLQNIIKQTSGKIYDISNRILQSLSLPRGMAKMSLVLTVSNKDVEVWEQKIIRLLTRDYYIFYSKRPKFDQWTELHFYSRPNDEASISYLLGHYAQVCFDTYTKEKLDNQTHQVYANYPKCIELIHPEIT